MGHLWRRETLQPHRHAADLKGIPIGDAGAADQALASAGGQAQR